ncbi:MAG: dephospho-CoA kinase [Planctomycetaceae bacterium]|nr:dephospho-CoA kinase [Planctomycetaceae bacterium]
MDSTQQQFVVLGFIGGVGSGKSTVAKWLGNRLPIDVIDGDQLGHSALKQPEIKQELIERFGVGIIAQDGEIDRSHLGKLVWGSHAEAVQARKDLERIVHPVIRKSMQDAVTQARRAGNWGIIIDAAVMIEAGWHNVCDKLIFIDTPDSHRLDHVISARNWSAEQWKQRENSQLGLDRKREYADFVIDNSGSVEWSGQQLLTWLHQQFGWSIQENSKT